MIRLISLRGAAAAVVVVGSALLSGCNSPIEKAAEAREAALSAPDSYQGYLSAQDAAGKMGCLFATKECKDNLWKGRVVLQEVIDNFLIRAAEQGNHRIISHAFSHELRYSDRVMPSLTAKVSAIESLLNRLDDPSISPDTLYLVSNELRRGEYAVQNYELAAYIAELAWQRGNVRAANLLMHIHTESMDIGNAYLWSIRCIGECRTWNHDDYVTGLRDKLDPESILRIQAAAADDSQMRMFETRDLAGFDL